MLSSPCLVPGPGRNFQWTEYMSLSSSSLSTLLLPEGASGKAPLAPSCCLQLHLPLPCPHTGSTHMWPPGRSSLVSIPSFSISICRKVLTFCRVSSSEYLHRCREGEGCSLGLGSLLACPPAHPPALSHKCTFHHAMTCPWSYHQARLPVLGKLKSCPL